MNFVRICTDKDGNSFLRDETWSMAEGEFTPPSPAGYSITETMRASGVLMMHHPAGYRDEWHCAPTMVLGTVVKGTIRIQTSDGDARLLEPGNQFVANDLTGTGHKIEEANGKAYDLALVTLVAGQEE